jgi:hypothetical protein
MAKRRRRTGSLKSANSAKIVHVSGCEGKSQKLTSRARLIKAIRDGVENSLPEILANFRGPASIGAEYHGNLPQVSLSNHQQPHGGCVGGHEIPLLLYRIDLSDIFPAVPQFHVGRGACQPRTTVCTAEKQRAFLPISNSGYPLCCWQAIAKSRQRVEQRLGVFQIERIETLGEPAETGARRSRASSRLP